MVKIGVVIPENSGNFCKDVEMLSQKLGIEPVFCVGHFSGVYPAIYQMLEKHPDIKAFIARSTTAEYLRRKFDLPVVDLELSDFDFVKTISDLPDKSGKFIVVQFYHSASTFNIKTIAEISGIHLQTIFLDPDNVGDVNKAVDQTGCNRVVSSVAVVTEPCRKAGKDIIPLRFLKKTIEEALRRALNLIESMSMAEKKTEQLMQILNASMEGFLATNAHGQIVLFNQVLSDITGLPACKAVYVNISDLAKSQPFIGMLMNAKDNEVFEYQGKHYIVSRPYFADTTLLQRIWSVNSLASIQDKTTVYQKKLVQNGFRARYKFGDMITVSPVMANLKKKAKKYAQTNCNILILGQSGTGKEMLAQSIHNESAYRDGPFVAINCAALPENLLESELFGYEEGAFTGARRHGKAGMLELSQYGTLFLDEIGTMPLPLQAKLLRVLQEKQFSRLGGTKLISVENRIICATNNNLMMDMQAGNFREDLFYRLDVLHIVVPPLRERTGDIPYLVRTLLKQKSREYHRLIGITDDQILRFMRYPWPGNFRQLDAFLERLIVLNSNSVVEDELLDMLFKEMDGGFYEARKESKEMLKGYVQEVNKKEVIEEGAENEKTLQNKQRIYNDCYMVSGTMSEIENQIIREGWHRCHNVQELSETLGLSRTTLWRKLKAMGIKNRE